MGAGNVAVVKAKGGTLTIWMGCALWYVGLNVVTLNRAAGVEGGAREPDLWPAQ